jgi:hypothetical protein
MIVNIRKWGTIPGAVARARPAGGRLLIVSDGPRFKVPHVFNVFHMIANAADHPVSGPQPLCGGIPLIFIKLSGLRFVG